MKYLLDDVKVRGRDHNQRQNKSKDVNKEDVWEISLIMSGSPDHGATEK